MKKIKNKLKFVWFQYKVIIVSMITTCLILKVLKSISLDVPLSLSLSPLNSPPPSLVLYHSAVLHMLTSLIQINKAKRIKIYIYVTDFIYVYTQRNLFEILLNQPEIILYLPFSYWFGYKRTSVWIQIKNTTHDCVTVHDVPLSPSLPKGYVRLG